MISNRVKRNISATLLAVGTLCTIGRAWEVAMSPKSGSAWFELCGMIFLTFLCFGSLMIFHRRIKARY